MWYRSNEVEDEEDVEEDDKEVEDDENGDEENGEDSAEDGDERDDDDDDETSAVGLRWTCICARTPSYLYSNNKFAPLAHANTS